MNEKHGNLSINSDNIFPIIKKWLYSDHDIFFRELVSNGCDAITKLKKLDMMGEYTLPDKYKPQVQILVNPDEKTLKFIDNGLGMTPQKLKEVQELLKNKETVNHPRSKKASIGLKNAHDRVKLILGEEYGMEIISCEGIGTIVKYILPVMREEEKWTVPIMKEEESHV